MRGDETTAGAPSQLGPYRLERVLGRGGMGAVFLAYDTTLHRRVALKMLDGGGSASSQLLLREARSAAGLNHPGICTIHEVGTAGEASFIAMEFVDGASLRSRLDHERLSVPEAIAIAAQAADALAYAHARNVVHRDFKAANLIVTAAGRVKIVDFGLARRDDEAVQQSTMMSAVPEGVAAGTPYAMAPEQVRGERADARSDIWAFGVLLYEMVSGAKPFHAPTTQELYSAILRDEPQPLGREVPPQLRSIIACCLAKDPARRYQNAADICEALKATEVARAEPRFTRLRRAWPAAAAIAIAAAAFWPAMTVDSEPPAPTTAERVAPIRLAVLPFNNLTGDADQEFFADGLTDETITQLGRLHPQRLSVIGHTSSMHYKNAALGLEQIGRELGVEYVLEGSARREGNHVRVTARLVQVRDQAQLWTDVFDRELASLMALQNDVARGVASSLALTLLPQEEQRLAAPSTVNAEAYEAYLRGLSHVGKLSRSDLERALEYFELAINKDPKFALAYTGIARVWTSRNQMQFATSREAAPRIRAALQQAASLSKEPLAELEFSRAATLTWTDWNWREGGAAYERALAIRPGYGDARAFYAHYLLVMGRQQESLQQIERALALDPFNDLYQSLYGVVLTSLGRYDDAIAQFRKALQTAPGSPVALNGMARAFHHSGRREEALAAERALWASRGDDEMVRVLSVNDRDYYATLRRAADLQAQRMDRSGAAPLYVGILYMRAGAHDEALTWLQRSFEARDPNVPYVVAGPNWAAVRDDPRFIAIQKKLGLP